ncbi:hypothetical protein PSHT_09755, partial [Puccinia striiformis]
MEQHNGTSNGHPVHSLSIIKRYRAYFSLVELDEMLRKQSAKLVPARVEAIRQQACVFIDRIGSRLGFPRRTIASALLLYHRFHLFFPFSEFNLHDVSIATVWLASKLEDTLKKLGRFNCSLEGGNGLGEPEASIIEAERHRLGGIERLLLESVCFDFGSGKPANGRDVFGYLIGIARRLQLSRNHIQLSFRLAIDSHRTLVGLTYPPHLIALSCLYLASFLRPFTQEEDLAKFHPDWNVPYQADIEDIEEICHQILDLLISLSSAVKSNQSPSSPSEAKAMKLNGGIGIPSATGESHSRLYLKIKLREIESQRREASGSADPTAAPRLVAGGAMMSQEIEELGSDGKEWLGRDDVTVRFIFGADGSENLVDPSCPPSRPAS